MNIKEDIKNNTLEINVNKKEVLAYQIGMVNRNDAIKIMKIDNIKMNSQNIILFDLTGRISLKKYLLSKEFTKEEALELLIKIIDIVLESVNYLLSENNFIIDSRYIYYESESTDINLIYIPINEEVNRDINLEFRKFVKDVMVDLITFSEIYETDGFIGILLNLTKEKNLSIENFKQRIEELLNMHLVKTKKSISSAIYLDSEKIEIVKEIGVTETNRASEYYKYSDSLDESSISGVNKGGKEKRHIALNWVRYGIILVQVFAIGIVSMLIVMEIETKMLMLSSCILILVDLIIVRFLMQHKMNHDEISIAKEESEFLDKQKNDEKGFINIGKKEIVSQNVYRTEMLEKSEPYFLLINEGITERVYLNKNNFIIGRLGGECDYVINNNTIGKRHIKITKVNKSMYLEDLSSKNGTYINGKKLDVGRLYKLEENFKIKISNILLTYKEI